MKFGACQGRSGRQVAAFLILGICMAGSMAWGARADETCGDLRPCRIEGGEYYVYFPDRLLKSAVAANPSGAILFLHGHRGKAENEIGNETFRAMAEELGVAFVAVAGQEGTWSFPNAPRALRDESAFFDRVIADLTERFPVDRNRMMLSGFSSGAFMTWYLACEKPRRFAGFAPIAGVFWEPLPQACAEPWPYLYHVHGTDDQVVPMAGRALGDGRFRQGDVYESFSVWLAQKGLTLRDGEVEQPEGDLTCTVWRASDNAVGAEPGVLELCLHPGGHSVRAEWLKRAWRKLEQARGWRR